MKTIQDIVPVADRTKTALSNSRKSWCGCWDSWMW